MSDAKISFDPVALGAAIWQESIPKHLHVQVWPKKRGSMRRYTSTGKTEGSAGMDTNVYDRNTKGRPEGGSFLLKYMLLRSLALTKGNGLKSIAH